MENKLIILILALGAINFSLRFFPALILNKMDLPEIVKEWLTFVPVSYYCGSCYTNVVRMEW